MTLDLGMHVIFSFISIYSQTFFFDVKHQFVKGAVVQSLCLCLAGAIGKDQKDRDSHWHVLGSSEGCVNVPCCD